MHEIVSFVNGPPAGPAGSLKTALRVADDFEVGALWINEASRFRPGMYPFGGGKANDVGREGPRYAIEETSQLKFVGIRS